jgi:hypothetical protein
VVKVETCGRARRRGRETLTERSEGKEPAKRLNRTTVYTASNGQAGDRAGGAYRPLGHEALQIATQQVVHP